jgi:hypothetical protein
MTTQWAGLAAAAALLAALAGCGDTEDDADPTGFDAMTDPCIERTASVSGLAPGNILVTDQIQTGGGPMLMLSAAGADYGCRLGADGSVTVFAAMAD